MGFSDCAMMYSSAANPYTTRSVAAAEFGLDRMEHGRGTPLQRYAAGDYGARAAQLQNLASLRPDFPWHGCQTESKLGLPMHEYESSSSSARHRQLQEENQRLKYELSSIRTVTPRLEDLDAAQASSRIILQLEEQNLRLQEQISHLKGELKAAGAVSTVGAVSAEFEQSAQTVLELQRKLELHEVSAQELEQALVLEIQTLKLALRDSQGCGDAEISKLRAAAQDDEIKAVKREAELMQAQNERDEARAALEAALRGGSSSDADLQASLDAIADLRAQLTAAKKKLNDTQLDLVASDSQLNDAQHEIASLHIQLANANKAANKDSGHLPLIAQLKTEIEANLNMIADLQDRLNRQPQLDKQENGLTTDFDFGRRVYQCTVPNPGVGYRNTPQFADKNKDGTGPQDPQVIIADRVCQGPSAVFIRCTSGKGWLPISNPDGKQQILKHIGKESEINLDEFQIADGSSKILPKRKVEWYKKSSKGGSGLNSPGAQDNMLSPK